MNPMIDVQTNEKNDIFKDLRDALTMRKDISRLNIDTSVLKPEPIDNLLITFNEKFRAAGGKYIPCTPQTLVKTLVQICSAQNLGTLLNTSPDLGHYLQKYKIPHLSAVHPDNPADVVLLFSDMLIARTGSIGFTPEMSLYPSVKNLARNMIVVSRERCIFPDLLDALNYRKKRDEGSGYSTVEFITPRQPDVNELGAPEFTPMNPRIILLMVEDSMAHPEPTVSKPQAINNYEPQNQEPAD